MQTPEFLAYLRKEKGRLKGPLALILDEDGAALAETLTHHLRLGFAKVIVLRGGGEPAALGPENEAAEAAGRLQLCRPGALGAQFGAQGAEALAAAANALAEAAPGAWLYCGYNAEFLFYPFCETRRIGEMLAFHAEERRAAMLTLLVDLYPGDLAAFPGGVAPEAAFLDQSGYFFRPRQEKAPPWAVLERQVDLFGGLRWRFEEFVPESARRIDRIALFRAAPGRHLGADFTLNEAEANTYACPWHHNLTAAVASFRAAKALCTNPESRRAVKGFLWPGSAPFRWSSEQLMELGMMEPGQWF